MRNVVIAALFSALAAPALAQEVSLQLGKADPQPEALAVFSDDLRMGARIVMDGTEDLATAVTGKAVMALQFGFWTDAEAKGLVRLQCSAAFVGPDGKKGAVVKEGLCFDGDLIERQDSWTQSEWDLKFHASNEDVPGTAAVMLTVTDEITGQKIVLAPTYRWLGME